jgi:hypothetical protein
VSVRKRSCRLRTLRWFVSAPSRALLMATSQKMGDTIVSVPFAAQRTRQRRTRQPRRPAAARQRAPATTARHGPPGAARLRNHSGSMFGRLAHAQLTQARP